MLRINELLVRLVDVFAVERLHKCFLVRETGALYEETTCGEAREVGGVPPLVWDFKSSGMLSSRESCLLTVSSGLEMRARPE
jgi:hypothetical protein